MTSICSYYFGHDMVKDRLSELRSVIKKEDGDFDFVEKDEYETTSNTVVDMEHEEAGYMAHFFSEVELSRSWIANIKGHIASIRALHSTLLSSPREEENLKLELDARTETVKQIAKKVNSNLKVLETGISQEEEELLDKDKLPAGLRIRKTQYSTTLRLLIDAITEFNAVQVDYKEKCEERIQRVVSIVKKEITDEQLEELLEQGNYGTIFNGDIITETLETKRALEDVQIRHQELLKLEKSIMELRTLFVEMALLVEHQGEIVNRIEHHVQHAAELVKSGNEGTKKAFKYKEKAHMKKIIFLVIACILLSCIVIVIYMKIFDGNGDKKNDRRINS